jgi:SNF2 family DNA or RNA helicase
MGPKLDDYQLDSYNWLYERQFTILGDEPGVGKTAPAIMAAGNVDPLGPHLVICPAYLATNWIAELEMWREYDIIVVDGSPKRKREILAEKHRWTIVSNALLARKEYLDVLMKRQWRVCVIDEAHHFRGRNSIKTKGLYQLRKQCQRIWMLTGTPLVADAGDLFPLLKVCDPKVFTSYWRFVETHCHLEWTPWAQKVGGLKDETAFYRLLSEWMLRRKLRDVRPEIPDYVEETLYVDVSQATHERLKRAKKDYIATRVSGEEVELTSGGALINFLRQAVIEDPVKVQACRDLVADLPHVPIVIFAWYRETVRRVADAFAEKSILVGVITGDDVGPSRMVMIDRFKRGEFPILVATFGALQEGVNLQNAKYVICIEGDWLDKTHTQAIARIVRRGQTDTVIVKNIVARKTVDTIVQKMRLMRKNWDLRAVIQEVLRDAD